MLGCLARATPAPAACAYGFAVFVSLQRLIAGFRLTLAFLARPSALPRLPALIWACAIALFRTFQVLPQGGLSSFLPDSGHPAWSKLDAGLLLQESLVDPRMPRTAFRASSSASIRLASIPFCRG
ncbi:hypothetical protein AURDEDRAFT_111935 [Auricularia subglabra TFB-10046 SS5]|nr:hypothetical protein AURDEDRAFT_111935 [Auricularia subglabra TFB-10046 SS5]